MGEPFWDLPWFPDFGREIIDREEFVFKGTPVIEQQTAHFLPSETVDGRDLHVVKARSSRRAQSAVFGSIRRTALFARASSLMTARAGWCENRNVGFFQEPSSGV